MKLSVHTRTFFLFFFFSFLSPSLSFSASFPGSSSLAPFSRARPFSLSRSVLRNTHTLYRRSSVLERSTLYHRDALSKIQPFFSRADQWALPLPLYPPVPALAFFVIRHSTGSKISYVSSFTRPLSRTISSAHFRWNTRAQMFSRTRGSALYRVRISLLLSPLAF